MKTQATRANAAQVQTHIQRQRALGERMVGENDKPRPLELIVTGAALVLMLCFA